MLSKPHVLHNVLFMANTAVVTQDSYVSMLAGRHMGYRYNIKWQE